MAIDHLNYSATVRHLPGTKLARAYEHMALLELNVGIKSSPLEYTPRSTQTNRITSPCFMVMVSLGKLKGSPELRNTSMNTVISINY